MTETNQENPWWLYTKFLSLLFIVSLIVGFNFARWGFHRQSQPNWSIPGGQPVKGKVLAREYGCQTCHIVPGYATRGTVGPRLDRLPEQLYLAGKLPNTPESFIQWVQDPPAIRPGTAMPNLYVSEDDARDLAAYLYQVREVGQP
jgi:cytochrome c